jgi:hypothetical protein
MGEDIIFLRQLRIEMGCISCSNHNGIVTVQSKISRFPKLYNTENFSWGLHFSLSPSAIGEETVGYTGLGNSVSNVLMSVSER